MLESKEYEIERLNRDVPVFERRGKRAKEGLTYRAQPCGSPPHASRAAELNATTASVVPVCSLGIAQMIEAVDIVSERHLSMTANRFQCFPFGGRAARHEQRSRRSTRPRMGGVSTPVEAQPVRKIGVAVLVRLLIHRG